MTRWVLPPRKSDDLALATDQTKLADRLCAAVASVVYWRCAVPVAWVAMSANKMDRWTYPAAELT